MYVQHPYKYEGKYFAKIDGEFIEISQEIAKVMRDDYRNQIYTSRKWAPEEEEEMIRKVKRTEILDCAFSANSDGLSVADMIDETQLSLEELMIQREESAELHRKIDRLSPRDQFIIKSIYFDGMKQVEVAEILGITKGRLNQRVRDILKKMRKMYQEEA